MAKSDRCTNIWGVGGQIALLKVVSGELHCNDAKSMSEFLSDG
jgi:hypothetical protein